MTSLAIVLLFLAIPIIGLVVAKFLSYEVSIIEVLVGIALEAALMCCLWFGGTYLSARDVQILNGEVLSKQQETVSCEHSYKCNCSTDDKGNETCQTCHEHFFDYDWVVNTSISNITIPRVDRQGEDEPPRFTKVIIGEPASVEVSYVNYIKASKHSIFNSGEDEAPLLAYPTVYDYYRADHAFEVGKSGADLAKYRTAMASMLKTLSPNKEANVILVFTPADPASIKENLEKAWAKKNDIVIYLRVKDSKIAYVDASAMSKTSKYLQMLRDSLLDKGVSDIKGVVDAVFLSVMKGYERRPMQEFEYLKYSISPPLWVLIMMGVLSIFGTVGLVILFHHTDW